MKRVRQARQSVSPRGIAAKLDEDLAFAVMGAGGGNDRGANGTEDNEREVAFDGHIEGGRPFTEWALLPENRVVIESRTFAPERLAVVENRHIIMARIPDQPSKPRIA